MDAETIAILRSQRFSIQNSENSATANAEPRGIPVTSRHSTTVSQCVQMYIDDAWRVAPGFPVED
jgi:hypothetical protein